MPFLLNEKIARRLVGPGLWCTRRDAGKARQKQRWWGRRGGIVHGTRRPRSELSPPRQSGPVDLAPNDVTPQSGHGSGR